MLCLALVDTAAFNWQRSLVQLYQLWLPHGFCQRVETITVADRKDFPDGRNIPQWMGSNGAFLLRDELNKTGAQYGDTLAVMNPEDYHNLRTADGANNGSYSERQLKALDFILYHGARGDQPENLIYGISADWRARSNTVCHLGCPARRPSSVTTVLPEASMARAAEALAKDALAYADSGGGGPEEGSAKLLIPPPTDKSSFFGNKTEAPKGQLKIKKHSALSQNIFQKRLSSP